jgi:hypothetical protein
MATDLYFFIDISADDNLSEAVDKRFMDLCGLIIPTMTSTAVTFLGSQDGVNFYPVWWDGAALSITVTSGVVTMLDPLWFSGVNYLKIGTGSGEAADRTIYPIWRAF